MGDSHGGAGVLGGAAGAAGVYGAAAANEGRVGRENAGEQDKEAFWANRSFLKATALSRILP